jgi:hypothetical protein
LTMGTFRKIAVFILYALGTFSALAENPDTVAGPLYAEFPLTLSSGYRHEAAGPLYYSQMSESQRQWALPPFFCYTRTADVDWTEMEILYPILSYRRFGPEFRLQLVQFFSFSGGRPPDQDNFHRFTLFPFYFQQRSADPSLNYTAVVPFYGHLEYRLFKDDIKFVMFPLYSETRKKDVVTDNYLYPFFSLRHGDAMSGWKVWPIIGDERKAPTTRTNIMGEPEIVGGYENFFAPWPIYFHNWTGLGTTNAETSRTIVPFYSHTESPSRVETSYGWPLGYNSIKDYERNITEHDFLWPLFVKARGAKETTRIFPFYSHAANSNLVSDFVLWPIYKYNALNAPTLERRRTRILFFLYSDTAEKNTSTGEVFRRKDFWPLYTYHHEMNGNERLQVLALAEPLLPNNRSISREYSPVWSLWRAEKNPRTGASSQSLLWNLYRRDKTPQSKKLSLFFGLFQYQSTAEAASWRVFYLKSHKKSAKSASPKS